MKKHAVILMAVLMVFGFSTAAAAAPVLTFDIDFERDGVMDTGSTYNLMMGDTVDVDLLFSITEEGVPGGGWDLRFDSSNLAASGLVIAMPFVNMGGSGISPGHVLFDAVVFPPGTFLGPGTEILMASFTLECTGISFDELWLYDPNPGSVQWVTSSGLVLDDVIWPGGDPIYLGAINNVPIPGAVWLLGSGLIGLIGIRRRMAA